MMTTTLADAHGVFLDLETVDQGDIDLGPLLESGTSWKLHRYTDPADVEDRIRDAHVVVSNKVVLDRQSIVSARRLGLICVAATGTNNVDLAAARAQGITVSNVTGYATAAVVQHVFGLVLALTTRLPDYQRAVAGGRWGNSRQFCLLDYPIRELGGLTLGIVGYGELGRGVAKVGEAFGMRVQISQRPGAPARPGRISLDDLLGEADVLSLHTPLADNTRNLIGARELALMKPDAILINTARGGIVDESSLAQALRKGHLGGAGVDVLAVEPPREGSPLLEPDIPNLIVTPHIAWASRQARQRLLDEVTANVRAFLEGNPRNRVA